MYCQNDHNFSFSFQTLEHIKRKQVEKYHKAPEGEKEAIECNPYVIFHKAMENCKPIVGLASIQKGGKSYQVRNKAEQLSYKADRVPSKYKHKLLILFRLTQVPIPLSENRRRFLAMKWMITECRENKHRRTHMYEKLSQELLAASAQEGNVIKKKFELHKMAEANRAYAHYRWW